MEYCTLTIGIPNFSGKAIKFRAFNQDSSAVDLLSISIPDGKESKFELNGNFNFNTSNGNFSIPYKPGNAYKFSSRSPEFDLMSINIFSNNNAELRMNGSFAFNNADGYFSVPKVQGCNFKFGSIKDNGDKSIWMSLTRDDDSSPVKMVIGKTTITGEVEDSFVIGSNRLSLDPISGNKTKFIPYLFVNSSGVKINGSLTTTTGQKPGFVVDYFINAVGESLEQGDLVVIGKNPAVEFWAKDNAIPIPEVDLTDAVCDTRVCGIVAEVVTKEELPFAKADLPQESNKKAKKRTLTESDLNHPLAHLVSEEEGEDKSQVPKNQLGKMVTMGAYAFCKVDASYGSIEPGDLLTTSPTKGHAQKVPADQKAQAIGAIVGKSLGSIKKGKGKIPILVMLQ